MCVCVCDYTFIRHKKHRKMKNVKRNLTENETIDYVRKFRRWMRLLILHTMDTDEKTINELAGIFKFL